MHGHHRCMYKSNDNIFKLHKMTVSNFVATERQHTVVVLLTWCATFNGKQLSSCIKLGEKHHKEKGCTSSIMLVLMRMSC